MKKILPILIFIISMAFVTEVSAQTFTYTVTSTNEWGAGSLRQAIQDAHSNVSGASGGVPNAGPSDIINLNVPAPYIINITSPIELNGGQNIIIDATTSQTGWNPGAPVVILRGNTGLTAIRMNGGTHTVRGLILQNLMQGITVTGGSNHTIQGCWFGIDNTGTTKTGVGITEQGILVNNVQGVLIGGTTPADRNVISGCVINGTGGDKRGAIQLMNNSHNTIIRGNYIGPSASGIVRIGNGNGEPLNQHGIFINNSSQAANPVIIEQNVISGNTGNGIWALDGCFGLRIRGNKIGTNANGTGRMSNKAAGIRIDGGNRHIIGYDGNDLTGTSEDKRNIISGNGGAVDSRPCRGAYCGEPSGDYDKYDGTLQCGIYFKSVGASGTAADSTVIAGNYIGVSATGLDTIGNLYAGIKVETGTRFVSIGGPDSRYRNVVGGNGFDYATVTAPITNYLGHGVQLNLATVNNITIKNNYIGIGADGRTPVGNRQDGVSILGAKNNTIVSNVISGNAWGVFLQTDFQPTQGQASGNIIRNNFIGTDYTGTTSVGAGGTELGNGRRTIPLDAEGGGIGLQHGAFSNTVTGNTINHNRDGIRINFGGNAATPPYSNTITSNTISQNVFTGIKLLDGAGTAGANIIGSPGAGNTITENGSFGIELDNADNNSIRSNTISTNTSHGINIHNGSAGNIIGGVAANEGNTISNNQGNGIVVDGAGTVNNSIHRNSFSCNALRGIVLSNGGNNAYAAPIISGTPTNMTFTGPAGSFIEVFSVDACQTCTGTNVNNNKLQGLTLIGSGVSPYTVAVPVGTTVTATASAGNTTAAHNTSEFSICTVLCPTITVDATSSATNNTTCTGETFTLSASVTPAGTYTYTWSPATGLSSTTAQNPTVTLTNANSYTYFVAVEDANGCTNTTPESITITVNQTPTAVTASSNSPVCTESSLNLTANATGAASYSWTGPGGFTAAVQNPTRANATVAMGGLYEVTAISAAGCSSTVASTTVVIRETPVNLTAGNNGPVCTENIINLTASATGATSYSWTGPGGFSSTDQNPVRANATAAMAGVYEVRAIANGCSTAVATTTVVMKVTPTAVTAGSNSPVCSGSSINLTAAATAPTSITYSWTGPNSFVSAQEDPAIPNSTTAMSGIYKVIATADGCSSAEASTTVVVNPMPTPSIAGASFDQCSNTNGVGYSTALNAGSTYLWTVDGGGGLTIVPPNNANTVTVNIGAVSGTLTVQETRNGCTATATQNINISPSLNPAIVGELQVCENTDGVVYSVTGNPGSSFTWGQTGGVTIVSSTTGTQVTVNVGSTDGTLTVNETSATCAGSGTITVIAKPRPVVNPTADAGSICIGESTTLRAGNINNAAGPYTYSWTPADNLVNPTSENPVATPDSVGLNEYYVTVTAGNACSNSTPAIIGITVKPRPVVTITSSSNAICLGDSVTLSASVTGVAGPYTYSWTPAADLDNATSENPVATPPDVKDHKYQLIVTAGNACGNADPAETIVTVKPRPVVTVTSSSNSICKGDSVTLSASITGVDGPYTYSWTPAADLDNAASENPIAKPQDVKDHIYQLTVIAGNACGNADPAETTVTVKPRPEVAVTSSAGSICIGESVNLNASVTGAAAGPYTYAWAPSADISPADGQNPVATPDSEGLNEYYVIVTAGNACSNLDTAKIGIIVKPRPVVTVTSSSNSICKGDSVTLSASITGVDGPYTYSWTPAADLDNAASENPIAKPQDVKDHIYQLTVIAGNACGNADPAETTVTVKPRPEVAVTSSAGSICIGESVNLNASVTGAAAGPYTYAWAPSADISPADGQNPVATPDSEGLNEYYVIVTAGNACSNLDTAKIGIIVKPRPVVTVTSSSDSICLGESVNLSASVTGAAGPYAYTWTPSADLSPADGQNPVATPVKEGENNYSLTVTASNMCGNSSPAIVKVVVKTRPIVSAAGDDAAICFGSSTTLRANVSGTGITGPYQYTWTPAADLASSTDQNPVCTPSATGSQTYTLVVTAANGCGNATPATVKVQVDEVPVIADAGANNPVPFCGQNAAFALTGNTPSPLSAVGTWSVYSGSGTFENSDIHNPNVKVMNMGSGLNKFVWTIVNGACAGSSDTLAILNNTPESNIVAATAGPCVGTGYSIQAIGSGGTIQWTAEAGAPADLLDDYTIINPTVNTSVPTGPWKLYLTVTGGCPVTDSVMVSVHPNPIASLAAPTDTICTGQDVNLLASSVQNGTAPYYYYWSSKDQSLKDSTWSVNAEASITHKTTSDGEMEYYVTIKDANGCYSDEDTTKVQIYKEQQLFIPSLITPNADEWNKCFVILDSDKKYNILPGAQFQLYNRWGQQVYRSDDYRNGQWCGSDLADGVYFYHLNTGCGNKEIKGWLHVIGNEAANK